MASGSSSQPPVSAANPGLGHLARAEFDGPNGAWEEVFDLVDMLQATLAQQGHESTRHKHWLELPTGFTLYPQWWGFGPGDNGVRTATTLQIAHPKLIPDGVFEYQHASGDDLRASFVSGFRSWSALDLPVLLDALQDERPTSCTYLQFGGERRRIVLGPVVHYAREPAPCDEEHCFCPCCLITNSMAAFEPLLKADRFVALRLYVARNPDGELAADCRANGEDFEPGKQALQRYGETWPQRGFEFRKQYVVMQTV